MSKEREQPEVTLTQAAAPSVSSAPHVDEGRFAPGALLAQRYCVVNLLGQGGMGEVYRANDLILGETVALKFLPKALAHDESLIARFRNEVRIARMVSHPNVCRVHDLAEAGGRPFLSMQYIDGEDLASLLRRIGRLPEDKALEIAHKLCAGLQAAHDKGVIHRDLKPANIMIDGRGEVMITDFGLAGIVNSIHDVSSGTPAYMAPEQRTGQEVTVRSDVYSLGLVLHEIFTGKRRTDLSGTCSKAIDPEIARVLDLCCDPTPARRPASPAAIARSLPGGDPLAAAIAAGRTPSPEMVAAAGERTGLRSPLALALVAIPIASLLISGWVSDQILPVRALSPQELQVQARDLVRKVEPALTRYEASGVTFNSGVSARGSRSATLWIPHEFWYRTSPVPLGSLRTSSTTEISPEDPPLNVPGMTMVVFDMTGKLIRYESELDPRAPVPASPPAWDDWLARTGVDKSRLTPVQQGADSGSWDYHDAGGHQYRIDGSAERGRLRRFQVRAEWEKAEGSPWPWRVEFILTTVAFCLAVQNYRLGRIDLRGTLTVTLFVLATAALVLALRGSDLLHWSRRITPVDGFSLALLLSLMFGAAYFAMEPFARRRWPVVLVTWTRLIHGDWRSPTVGRDVLIGLAACGVMRTIAALARLWFLPVDYAPLTSLQSTPFFLAGLIGSLSQGLARAVGQMFLLFLARRLLRSDWLAAGAITLLFAAMILGQLGIFSLPAIILMTLVGAVQVGLAMRFGLLAAASAEVLVICSAYVQTLDSTHWFAIYSYLTIAMIGTLAYAAFHIATAGQRILADDPE